MRLLGFKNQIIGWLILYIILGFVPLAFSGEIIHPFLITPEADVEKYNYAAGIVDTLQPCLLLYLLWASIDFLNHVNIDPKVNDWIKKSTQDVSAIVLALLFYQIKEVVDYLLFENVVPECVSQIWFLVVWELMPVITIMVWAILKAKKE